ncbi:unnamed protein product, partial [Musa textilis]
VSEKFRIRKHPRGHVACRSAKKKKKKKKTLNDLRLRIPS